MEPRTVAATAPGRMALLANGGASVVAGRGAGREAVVEVWAYPVMLLCSKAHVHFAES